MLVIIDIEWVTIKGGRFCPTQISAIRIDDKWNSLERFDSLIRPISPLYYTWDHEAYSGAKPEAFINAPSGFAVLKRLNEWLKEDDILCWWADYKAKFFKELVKIMQKREVLHTMCSLYHLWQVNVSDDLPGKGSIYSLALIRGIPVPSVENSSANNVEIIRALLQYSHISTSIIYNTILSTTANSACAQHNALEADSTLTRTSTFFSKHFLYYDSKKHLLHSYNCPDINPSMTLQVFDDYKTCIRQGFNPCKCCSRDYWKANFEECNRIIHACGFNYIYQSLDLFFHRTDCDRLIRIPYSELRGDVYFSNCLKKGLRPCTHCNPTKEQQKNPLHVYAQDPSKHYYVNSTDKHWTTTRKLSKDEKKALLRYKKAREERTELSHETRHKTLIEQRDEHKLTQTNYAFWAAIGHETFHMRDCPKLQVLSELKGFSRFRDAVKTGLKPCKLCRPSSKYDITTSVPFYQNVRQDEHIEILDQLCESQNFKHYYESPDYYIDTPVGKWRIVINTRPIDVYHINLVKRSITESFHKQNRLFLSLIDTFEYIKRHDYELIKVYTYERHKKNAKK